MAGRACWSRIRESCHQTRHRGTGQPMPFFTASHLEIALAKLPTQTHTSLVSFLAMLRYGVPIAATPSKAFLITHFPQSRNAW